MLRKVLLNKAKKLEVPFSCFQGNEGLQKQQRGCSSPLLFNPGFHYFHRE